ncbi:hypothetical protein L560_3850 [Bordetella pertussis STO1-CHOC-0018]|nr:hypothetical protein L560_3850 [Bordetella pertussis STO1-CHOC-0018]
MSAERPSAKKIPVPCPVSTRRWSSTAQARSCLLSMGKEDHGLRLRSGRPPRPSRAAKAPPNGTGHARRAGGMRTGRYAGGRSRRRAADGGAGRGPGALCRPGRHYPAVRPRRGARPRQRRPARRVLGARRPGAPARWQRPGRAPARRRHLRAAGAARRPGRPAGAGHHRG